LLRRSVRWPSGVKSAVMLTFDLDAETLWTSRNPANWERQALLSEGSYGPRVGVPRLLELLDAHEVKATFFIPAWVVERYPGVARDIADRGHEIGYHGYLHEFDPLLSVDEEREVIEKSCAIIERTVGRRPRGYRPPMNDITEDRIRLVLEQGFEYASCMMDDDVPYYHSVDGERTSLLQLPTSWMYDDSSYFFFTLSEPVRRGISSASKVLEIWSDEFEGLYEEGSSMVLIVHPQISGRVSRVRMLGDLIERIKAHEGAWIARCIDVSDALRSGDGRVDG